MDDPNIIILDIDGTLIGDITPQLLLYELNNNIKRISNGKDNIFNIKNFRNNLNEIIRPYIIKFIKTIKNINKNTEIFIYTASEKKWANFLIPHIEKITNIKFNRPIFTRSECIINNTTHEKKLKIILPKILKSLKKKYNNSQIKNFVMIDNCDKIFSNNDKKNLLNCSTYNYKYPENIPLYINNQIYNKYNYLINNLIFGSGIQYSKNYLNFQKKYYKYYIDNIIKKEDDKYFLYLTKIILKKNIKYFDINIINYINKKIYKKFEENNCNNI